MMASIIRPLSCLLGGLNELTRLYITRKRHVIGFYTVAIFSETSIHWRQARALSTNLKSQTSKKPIFAFNELHPDQIRHNRKRKQAVCWRYIGEGRLDRKDRPGH